MQLDAQNTIPLYQQLKEIIKNSIVAHELKPGAKIPTEVELSRQYNVSRITVRKAVEALCAEGLLQKKQGKGTFVQYKRIQRKMEHLLSFTEACLCNGMEPSSEVLEREVLEPESKEEAEFYGVEPGGRVLMIRRIRKADGVPVMYETNYYSMERFNFLLDEPLKESLYLLLKHKYHIYVHASKETWLDVIKADMKLAKLLDVGCGDPLYLMHTKIYDDKGLLIHVGIEHIVCERYRFSLPDHYINLKN